MRRNISLLIAACILALCLSACGADSPKGGTEPQPTVQHETVPPESAQPVPTATAPGVTNPPEPILEPYLTMDHYLSYVLPDSLAEGEYHGDQASLGGTVFRLQETGECEAKQAGAYAPIGWNAYGGVEMYYRLECVFEEGHLTDLMPPWNHSLFLDQPEILAGCDGAAIIVPVSHDLYTAPQIQEYDLTAEESTSEMWYVFFAREKSDIGYALFLNREYFSKEDTIRLARSVRFKDGAFHIDVR